jgi:hypothetical protein
VSFGARSSRIIPVTDWRVITFYGKGSRLATHGQGMKNTFAAMPQPLAGISDTLDASESEVLCATHRMCLRFPDIRAASEALGTRECLAQPAHRAPNIHLTLHLASPLMASPWHLPQVWSVLHEPGRTP